MAEERDPYHNEQIAEEINSYHHEQRAEEIGPITMCADGRGKRSYKLIRWFEVCRRSKEEFATSGNQRLYIYMNHACSFLVPSFETVKFIKRETAVYMRISNECGVVSTHDQRK